jgi:16S rRNA (guanine966-N2)-methyltransferase
MRIITGKHKGRKLLDCRKMRDLRPTTDRNREGLFNILSSASFLEDFDLTKCDLLDVFSGSGSISFEALSRGLRSATLIDINSEHIELSKNNAKILGEEKNCQFINFDLSKPIFQSSQNYNLIFIDPPYQKELIEGTLLNLIKGNFIDKNALIIIEFSIYDKLDLSKISELNLIAEKKYSKTIFNFFSLKQA